MDPFKVPKKVNRNVLKAFSTLQSSRTDFIRVVDITNQVKIQMRNCVPVADVEGAVKESLCNMTKLGILKRLGPAKYGLSCPVYVRLGRALPNPTTNVPGNPGTPLRRAVQNARRKPSFGNLNPWRPATKMLSEESLSGNEMDKTRKRMRSNTKKIHKQKKEVALPRQGPKQAKGFQNQKFNGKEVINNRIKDAKPGSTTTATSVEVGTSLPAGNWKPRILQDLPAVVCDECRHAFPILSRHYVSQSSSTSTLCCNTPIGLSVRPTGYSSGEESDVANASVLGLCGSPFRLRMEQSLSPSYVENEERLPIFQGDSIFDGAQRGTCQEPSSNTQEFQPINVFQDKPNSISENNDNISCLAETNSFNSPNLLPVPLDVQGSISKDASSPLNMNRSISQGFISTIAQENLNLTGEDVKIVKSLNIQTEQPSNSAKSAPKCV
ncbi:uncharacterized protein vrs [Drosophila takahashii]|uniref:uncharacterized protein vrs n=1 Tax=Drosophila takahashii TaxID=29030 RepID=UPI001CF8CC7D|nr:uncharacterized protein LOC108059516 [Drosophila takahashii]